MTDAPGGDDRREPPAPPPPWAPPPAPRYPSPAPRYPSPAPSGAPGHVPGPWWAYPLPAPPTRTPPWVWGLVAALAVIVAVAVGGGAWVLTAGPRSYGDDPTLDRLWDACDRGVMRACDRLYLDSPFFSDYEEFGLTCGGRTAGAAECAP